MKFIYLTIIGLLLANTVFAQQASISGSITDFKTGEALPSAIISLKDYKQGSHTNFDGTYSLKNLSEGTYFLTISFIGYETTIEKVTLKKNQNIVKNYSLHEATLELQDVEIIGRKRTSYKPDVTYAGTKVAVDIKDVPQSIAIINKEILKDQGVFRLNEVTANVAGVTRTRSNDNFTSRGFRISHDFINGNRALLGQDFSSSTIATQYERIEFIKGPATAIFGNSAPGGVINAVTKKPLKENRAYASVSIGGFEEVDDIAKKRATLDITGPLNEDKTLLYRTNVAWENSESFTDFQKNRSFLFAPSISFLPTDKTSVNVDLVGSFNNDDAGIKRGLPVLQNDLFALPINFSAAEPYDFRQNTNTLLTASINHKFFKFLNFNASYTRSDFDQNFIETRSNNSFTDDGSELTRRIVQRNSEGESDFITAYFVSNFKTGKIKHKALLGWDFYQTETFQDSRNAVGEVNGVPNLVFNNRIPIENISELDLNFDDSSIIFQTNTSYRGFYFQDLIELGKFKLLAAIRYEDLKNDFQNPNLTALDENIDSDVFLPRLGLTYSLNKNVNLYASYTEGFELPELPSTFNEITPGEEFDPIESNQFEIGTKVNFFKGKLLAQLSLYHINRTGRLISNEQGLAVSAIQLGEEISRGVEVELTGNITRNITLTANYAYNNAEIDDDDFTQLTNSQTTFLANTTASNNPEHTAGFWAKYTFKNNNFLKNFDIGMGGNYVSESKLFDDDIIANENFIELPSYLIFNQRIGYNYKKVDIALNINNILDERYFIGGVDVSRVNPGAPSNFLLTLGYQF